MRIKTYIILIVFLATITFPINYLNAANLTNQLKGKILLQVESNGEAFYVNPADNMRYYMGRPMDAYLLMRKLGVGITNSNLEKIEIGSGEAYDKGKIDLSFAKSNSGKIFLQVEEQGQAWYIYPDDNKRYYLGRPRDAFNIMRQLGLGISNADLALIPSAEVEQEEIEILPWAYSKTKTNVYYDETLIVGADASTFRVIRAGTAVDKNTLYISGKKIIEDNPLGDVNFFEVSEYYGDIAYNTTARYIEYKKEIYDLSGNKLEYADPESFEIINYQSHYAKDKNNVYFKNHRLENADPESFIVLRSSIDDVAKDKNQVYINEIILSGADANTFTFVGGYGGNYGSVYTKDENHVYKGIEILAGISPCDYEHLSNNYSKNCEAVYHHDVLIESADPNSFEILAIDYAKDNKDVFYKSNKINEADVETFEVSKTQAWFARDKNNIYKYGQIVDEYYPGAF